MRLRAYLLPLAILLAYWAISHDYLSVFPAVGQDEPWIASGSYQFATTGVYGTQLFAGYYHMEQNFYQHMPLYPVMLAGAFKLVGVGVFQMRLLPVACGLIVLVTTFALGRQIGGERVGILAVVLLLGLRLAAGDDKTGMPLLDAARINRYDIGVPLFGLLAMWVFGRAEQQHTRHLYMLTGGLAGLSSLCHLYGVFWLPALLAVILVRRGLQSVRQMDVYLVVLGFGLTWLPWIIYILSDLPDYAGQMRYHSDRFDIFSLSFYVQNLLRELGRYRTLSGLADLSTLQPGAWLAVLALPVALGAMLWRGWRERKDRAFGLALALLIQGTMFALLIQVKSYNYLIALWPLAALSIAWLAVQVWEGAHPRHPRHPRQQQARAGQQATPDRIGRPPACAEGGWRVAGQHATPDLAPPPTTGEGGCRPPTAPVEGGWQVAGRWVWRVVGSLILAIVLLEGALHLAQRHVLAAQATPYDQFTARVAALIPPESRVLGLPHYWLGLRQFPYRTWVLPILYADPHYTTEPVTFKQALERVNPDVILIDRYMGEYFDAMASPSDPNHTWYVQWQEFMKVRHAQLAGVVDDATYGRLSVYHLERSEP